MSEDHGHVGAAAAPYFFLSHAPAPGNGNGALPEPDYWVTKLFLDLRDRVAALTAMPPGWQAGFLECDLTPGHDWPDEFTRALATCRVFVPLYSRRYFESGQCGREWSVFSGRRGGRGAASSAAIVPAVWVPVPDELLPAPARSVPVDDAGLQSYRDGGFYQIIKLSRYRDDYQRAVDSLARRIVAAAENPPGPAAFELDHTTVPSAFGASSRQAPAGRPLRVTIVAPRLDELPDNRGTDRYGDSALDWHPYQSESVRPFAEYVADTVRALGYWPVLGDFDDREAAAGGGGPLTPEILIVDPWAALQDKYLEQLVRLDVTDTPWVQVIVPWSWQDKESEAAEGQLRAALEGALGRKLAQGLSTSALAVRGVSTLADFDQVLPVVTAKAARQYLRYAPAYPPAGDSVERPRLGVAMMNL